MEYLQIFSSNINYISEYPILSDLLEQMLMILENDDEDSLPSPDIVIDYTLPVIFKCLVLQEDNNINENFGPPEAAGTGLLLLVEKYQNIPNYVIPFITTNIHRDDSNWRYIDAAIISFGTLMKTKYHELEIRNLIQLILPYLLQYMNQSHSMLLKHSALWAIGQIFTEKLELVFSSSIDITSIFPLLINCLNDSNIKIQEQATTSIGLYGEALQNISMEEEKSHNSRLLFVLLEKLFDTLLHTTNINFGAMIYQAMAYLIENIDSEYTQELNSLLIVTMNRLDIALMNLSPEVEMLCSLLYSLLTPLTLEIIRPHIPILVNLLVRVISSETMTDNIDGILAFSKFTDEFPEIIQQNHDVISQTLSRLLESNPSKDLLRFLGDFARAMQTGILSDLDTFLPLLLAILRNPSHR